MPLTAPQGSKKGFEAGIYDAICYCVLDFGLQEDKFGTGHKILLGWKLIDRTYSDGNYVSYHQTFTLSLNDRAKLKEILTSWQPETDFSQTCFSKLLNKGAKLVLAPNMNGNVSAKSCMQFETEEKIEVEFFSFDDWKKDGCGELPEFLNTERNAWKKDRITSSMTYKELKEGQPLRPIVVDDSDVPF